MDEMKIKMQSKIMCKMISKLISKIIYKKTKIKIDVYINSIGLEKVNSDYKAHLNLDANMNEREFLKITRLNELD